LNYSWSCNEGEDHSYGPGVMPRTLLSLFLHMFIMILQALCPTALNFLQNDFYLRRQFRQFGRQIFRHGDQPLRLRSGFDTLTNDLHG